MVSRFVATIQLRGAGHSAQLALLCFHQVSFELETLRGYHGETLFLEHDFDILALRSEGIGDLVKHRSFVCTAICLIREALLDAVFAHLFVEKPSVNTEKFRRPALVPLRLSQSAFDKGFFQL